MFGGLVDIESLIPTVATNQMVRKSTLPPPISLFGSTEAHTLEDTTPLQGAVAIAATQESTTPVPTGIIMVGRHKMKVTRKRPPHWDVGGGSPRRATGGARWIGIGFASTGGATGIGGGLPGGGTSR